MLPSALAWTDVLDNVQQALAQTEADAARAEQALGSSPSPASSDAERQMLEQQQERFNRLHACVARAEQTAAQAEAALQDSEEVLRRWVAEAEALRGRLANRATPPVS